MLCYSVKTEHFLSDVVTPPRGSEQHAAMIMMKAEC